MQHKCEKSKKVLMKVKHIANNIRILIHSSPNERAVRQVPSKLLNFASDTDLTNIPTAQLT